MMKIINLFIDGRYWIYKRDIMKRFKEVPVYELSEKVSKQIIIDFLLDRCAIKMTNGLYGNYEYLVRKGFANYNDGFLSKNWKTEYYTKSVSNPINNRFEILDL